MITTPTLPNDVQTLLRQRHLFCDGNWPAAGASPEQTQFTDLGSTSPSMGASFCVPAHDLSVLGIEVAHDAIRARFAAAKTPVAEPLAYLSR